jgi:hypothetical protein
MNTPTIKFLDGHVYGHKWLCVINDGPGHSGLGNTQAEALINAGIAWHGYEDTLKAKYNPGNKFFLRKNGYYFRPGAKGYTGTHLKAGLFSQEEAEAYVAHSEGVTMHHAPV